MDKVNNQQLFRHQVQNDKARPANRHFIPEQVNKIAESYEKQFAQFLLQEFHKSVPKSQDASTAGDIYKSWMIDKQAQTVSKNKDGIGIKELILDEIYPRKYRNQAAYDGYQKSQAAQALRAQNAYQSAAIKREDPVEILTKTEPNLEVNKTKGASNE